MFNGPITDVLFQLNWSYSCLLLDCNLKLWRVTLILLGLNKVSIMNEGQVEERAVIQWWNKEESWWREEVRTGETAEHQVG